MRYPQKSKSILLTLSPQRFLILFAVAAFFIFYFLFFIFRFAPLFAQTTPSPDAIAIRVIPNPDHYSPLHWYQNQGFAGSPQSLTVDGYGAVRDGRTVYVNAANVDLNTNTLYTNIYLISYNQDAESATVDIFGRILEHWKFNTNVSGTGNCSESNAKSDCTGTVGCWDFEGNFNDASGKSHNGTKSGGVTFTKGIIGQAADFDGKSGSSIDVGKIDYSGWTEATFFAWVQVRDFNNHHSIICNNESTAPGGGFWTSTYSGVNQNIYFEADCIGNCAIPLGYYGGISIPFSSYKDKWTFVAYTINNSFMKIYINGQEVSSRVTAEGVSLNSIYNTYIGRVVGPIWNGYEWNGLIDEVKIYDRALSASEVQSNYNQVYSQCLSDSECSSGGYCSSLKSRIIRDTKRLSELVEVKLKLAEFKQSNNHYPKLDSGTYLTNKTISTWPSWQETLAQELGVALPLDPINKLGACSGYDSITCWDEQTKKFADPTPGNGIFNLPDNSNAFVYTTDVQGAAYNICANMESGLISPTMGNCIGNVIANNPPVIAGINLPIVGSGKEYIGYVSATDPDGDILSWSINTTGTTWTGWSAPPVLQPAGTNSQKKIYAAKTGNIGIYSFYITVSDGRGGSYTNPTAYQITIGSCVDADSDGYGDCPSCGVASGCLKNGDDCDDTKDYINPGSPETCDKNDNNCNGQTDEGCDDDSDNYCDNSMKFYNNPVTACPLSNLTNGSWGDDCDDSKNNINAGATEICNNSIDEDCNGSDLICTIVCNDNDNDGYGSPASTACAHATLDCNDNDPNVNPGAIESGLAICNGVDNDCDGIIDEQCDIDNDNYCNCSNLFTPASDLTAVCSGTNTTDNTSWANTCDCNDNNISINPGVGEICNNGNVDDDCDGDEDCLDAECLAAPACTAPGLCVDGDSDGYGNPVTNCTSPQLDCDDTKASINPGATENCANGVDDNCDALSDCADPLCSATPACITCGNPACDVGECSSCPGDCNPAACCGNAITDFAGEDCDDGNSVDNDKCDNSCIKTYCGDGAVQNNPHNGDDILEQCDDGNTTAGDGCDDNCQINWCYIKPPDMISWWTGENNADDEIDGNNGAEVSGVGYTAGIVGQAFNLLDNGASHIKVPHASNLQMNATTGISFGAWFKPDPINQDVGFILNKYQLPGQGYMLKYNNQTVQASGGNSGCGNNSNAAIQTLSLSGPRWIFAMATISPGSPATLKLYVDNLSEVSIGEVYHCDTSSNDFLIGDKPVLGSYHFEGYIDEAMFFNRELTANEVEQIYNAGFNGVGMCP